MVSDANGEVGGPIRLDSLLLDLDAKLRFEAWASIHQLGMLADHEITYDIVAHRFRVVAPVDCEEPDEPARAEELG